MAASSPLKLTADSGAVLKPLITGANRSIDTARLELGTGGFRLIGASPDTVVAYDAHAEASAFESYDVDPGDYQIKISDWYDAFRGTRKSDPISIRTKEPDYEDLDDLLNVTYSSEKRVLRSKGLTTPAQVRDAPVSELVGETDWEYEGEPRTAELDEDDAAKIQRKFDPVVIIESDGEDVVDSDDPDDYPRLRTPTKDKPSFPDNADEKLVASADVNAQDFSKAVRAIDTVSTNALVGVTEGTVVLHGEGDTDEVNATLDGDVMGDRAAGTYSVSFLSDLRMSIDRKASTTLTLAVPTPDDYEGDSEDDLEEHDTKTFPMQGSYEIADGGAHVTTWIAPRLRTNAEHENEDQALERVSPSNYSAASGDVRLDAVTTGQKAKAWFKLMSHRVAECKLDLSASGIEAQFVDPANVMMQVANLRASAFESFTYHGGKGRLWHQDNTLGFPLNRCLDHLKLFTKTDEVRFQADENANWIISGDYFTAKLPTFDPDSVRSRPDLPGLELPGKAVVDSGSFDESVDACTEAGDHVAVITYDGETYTFTDGDTEDVWRAVDTSDGEGFSSSLYSGDYLGDYLGAIPRGAHDDMTIYSGREFPMFANHEMHGGDFTLMLAPRISGDGSDVDVRRGVYAWETISEQGLDPERIAEAEPRFDFSDGTRPIYMADKPDQDVHETETTPEPTTTTPEDGPDEVEVYDPTGEFEDEVDEWAAQVAERHEAHQAELDRRKYTREDAMIPEDRSETHGTITVDGSRIPREDAVQPSEEEHWEEMLVEVYDPTREGQTNEDGYPSAPEQIGEFNRNDPKPGHYRWETDESPQTVVTASKTGVNNTWTARVVQNRNQAEKAGQLDANEAVDQAVEWAREYDDDETVTFYVTSHHHVDLPETIGDWRLINTLTDENRPVYSDGDLELQVDRRHSTDVVHRRYDVSLYDPDKSAGNQIQEVLAEGISPEESLDVIREYATPDESPMDSNWDEGDVGAVATDADIAEKRARILLKQFGSLDALAEGALQDPSTLTRQDGIGDATRKKVVQFAKTYTRTPGSDDESEDAGSEKPVPKHFGDYRREKVERLEETPHLDPIESFESVEEMADAIREIHVSDYSSPPEDTIEKLRHYFGRLPDEEAERYYLNDYKLSRTLNSARRHFNKWVGKKKRYDKMPGSMEAGPSNYPVKKHKKRRDSAHKAREKLDEKLDRLNGRTKGAFRRALKKAGYSEAELNEQKRQDTREGMRSTLYPGAIVFSRDVIHGPNIWGVKRLNKKSVRLKRPNGGTGYDHTTVDYDDRYLKHIPKGEIADLDPDEIEADVAPELLEDYDAAVRHLMGGEWVDENLDPSNQGEDPYADAGGLSADQKDAIQAATQDGDLKGVLSEVKGISASGPFALKDWETRDIETPGDLVAHYDEHGNFQKVRGVGPSTSETLETAIPVVRDALTTAETETESVDEPEDPHSGGFWDCIEADTTKQLAYRKTPAKETSHIQINECRECGRLHVIEWWNKGDPNESVNRYGFGDPDEQPTPESVAAEYEVELSTESMKDTTESTSNFVEEQAEKESPELAAALRNDGINNVVAANLARNYDSREEIRDAIDAEGDVTNLQGVGEKTAKQVRDAFYGPGQGIPPGEGPPDDGGYEVGATVDDDYEGDYKNKRMENAHYWAAELLGWMKNGPNAGLRNSYYVDVLAGKPVLVMDGEKFNHKSNRKAIKDGLRDVGFPSPMRIKEGTQGNYRLFISEPNDDRLTSSYHPDWRTFEPTGGDGGDPDAMFRADQLEWEHPKPTNSGGDSTGDESRGGTSNVPDKERREAVKAASDADVEGELPAPALQALKKAWRGYKAGIRDGKEAVEEVEEYRQETREMAEENAAIINDIRDAYGQEPIDFDGVEGIPEVPEVGGPITANDPGVSLDFAWNADPYDPTKEEI